MVEFVWAQCKICTAICGEVRILDDTPSHNFKRLLDVHDLVSSQADRGLCCSLFKNHLEVRKKFDGFLL